MHFNLSSCSIKKKSSAFSTTELILAGGYLNGALSDVVEKYNIQTGKGNFTIFLFYTSTVCNQAIADTAIQLENSYRNKQY
jgi:hypothetical protein